MTLDEVRVRMRAAGVEIPEDRLELVRRLLTDALGPIRALDARAAKALEPAVRFDAAAPRDVDGG
ncbi:MAG: hypothetical protein A3D33_00560 [Candidatus Rokubacteria bacterium RIFCSPHIGHO2_02_FULL_73_26]|nr:MAG: hypothetical protein A3D33_00560 [Candidatus Rokubacteria bacterium RIFCSPHIGHO2_02_FULL_73_26]